MMEAFDRASRSDGGCVPPGDATCSNDREANSAFWRRTISPLVNKTAWAISSWLNERVVGAATLDLEHVPAF
ncbi:MAG: hypothetical protein QM773_17325 [Hyphomonadaceae bacterium]